MSNYYRSGDAAASGCGMVVIGAGVLIVVGIVSLVFIL